MSNVFESLGRDEARRSERDAGEAGSESGELLEEPREIRWEGAIFERVTSIERQLAALEESLGKRVPEVEERLLHLLEGRLAALEGELHQSMSSLSAELAAEADRSRSDLRRVLFAVAAVGLLVLLF
jgi:hypothetical protein